MATRFETGIDEAILDNVIKQDPQEQKLALYSWFKSLSAEAKVGATVFLTMLVSTVLGCMPERNSANPLPGDVSATPSGAPTEVAPVVFEPSTLTSKQVDFTETYPASLAPYADALGQMAKANGLPFNVLPPTTFIEVGRGEARVDFSLTALTTVRGIDDADGKLGEPKPISALVYEDENGQVQSGYAVGGMLRQDEEGHLNIMTHVLPEKQLQIWRSGEATNKQFALGEPIYIIPVKDGITADQVRQAQADLRAGKITSQQFMEQIALGIGFNQPGSSTERVDIDMEELTSKPGNHTLDNLIGYLTGAQPANAMELIVTATPEGFVNATVTLTLTPPSAEETIAPSPTPEEAALAEFMTSIEYRQEKDHFFEVSGLTEKDVTFEIEKKTINGQETQFLVARLGSKSLLPPEDTENPTSSVPLFVLMKDKDGKEHWDNRALPKIASAQGFHISTQVVGYALRDPDYVEAVTSLANGVLVAGELDIPVNFEGFKAADWQTIVENWDEIKAMLDMGVIPSKSEFGTFDFSSKYDWAAADKVIKFAEAQGMDNITAQFLLNDIPEEVLSLPEADRWKVLEFLTKVRVIKYKGRIDTWGVTNEIVAHKKWGRNSPKGEMHTAFKWEEGIAKVAEWIIEADPEAKPMITENHILATNDPLFRSFQSEFLALVKKLIKSKEEGGYGAPIKVVGFHNHMWVYAPELPPNSELERIISEFRELGLEVVSSETTVNTAKEDVITNGEREPRELSADPLLVQEQILYALMKALFDQDGDFIFFGAADNEWVSMYKHYPGPDGQPVDAQAHPFDKNYRAKLIYYMYLQFLFGQL